jgi:CRISPR/Cas system-associated endonuclease Cas1
VDRLVLKLFNRGLLDDDDFETRGDAPQLYLKKESLKIFIRHYEEWANSVNRTWGDEGEVSWRRAFWKQAEKLRRCVEHNERYTPFSWKDDSEQKVHGAAANAGGADNEAETAAESGGA